MLSFKLAWTTERVSRWLQRPTNQQTDFLHGRVRKLGGHCGRNNADLEKSTNYSETGSVQLVEIDLQQGSGHWKRSV